MDVEQQPFASEVRDEFQEFMRDGQFEVEQGTDIPETDVDGEEIEDDLEQPMDDILNEPRTQSILLFAHELLATPSTNLEPLPRLSLRLEGFLVDVAFMKRKHKLSDAAVESCNYWKIQWMKEIS
jgi:hypothetical protein